MSAHPVVPEHDGDGTPLIRRACSELHDRVEIVPTTLQIERDRPEGPCGLRRSGCHRPRGRRDAERVRHPTQPPPLAAYDAGDGGAGMAFQGFSDDTIPFYRELHEKNDRAFWLANRARYDDGIRAPMLELLDELSSAFGEAKLFRPYRDVRFAKDKRPYKETIAATLGARYLSIGREGLYVGAGAYRMQGDTLARYRAAVADSAGAALESVLDALDDEGYRLAEPELSRGPTDYPRDHPRIELLKHKSVTATRDFGVPDWLTEPSALDHIAETFADLEGLASWVERHVR